MIPKIVHYVWVGGPKPLSVEQNIESWKSVLPDYKFMEWNESNWDVDKNLFAQHFYKIGRKGYAFVGDPIRVDVLNRYGGIYLDTDVHVYKSFDSLLDKQLVLGRIYNNALGTAVIMAGKGNVRIREINNIYSRFTEESLNDSTIDKVSNGIFTRYFNDRGLGLKSGNRKQVLTDGTLILPKQYFELPAFWFERGTFATHDAVGSWHESAKMKKRGQAAVFRAAIHHLAPALIARRRNFVAGRNNSIARGTMRSLDEPK